MKVRILTHTPEPEKLIAAAAKLCYASAEIDELLDGLTAEKTASFIERLESLGHESPFRACLVHLRDRGRLTGTAGTDHAASHRVLLRTKSAVCK